MQRENYIRSVQNSRRPGPTYPVVKIMIWVFLLSCTTATQELVSETQTSDEAKNILPRPLGSKTIQKIRQPEDILSSKDEKAKPSTGARSFSARHIMEALHRAYPQKTRSVTWRNGDLALQVRGTWFYWAHGRLLPEDARSRWKKYARYPFYQYSKTLPPLPELSEEEQEALERRLESREADPPRRHPGLYNALWRVYDKETSWQRVKTTYFLGMKTEIHRELLEDLARVEEEIFAKMEHDNELRRFVRSLASLEGYNWRPIAGTSSLSFHSYGVAIDILPRSYGGKQVYWRWAKPHYEEWYSLPYSKRYMPPASFIKAFENHGFVWGGKWFYFDTIHFEYRPEMLILNGFTDLTRDDINPEFPLQP